MIEVDDETDLPAPISLHEPHQPLALSLGRLSHLLAKLHSGALPAEGWKGGST